MYGINACECKKLKLSNEYNNKAFTQHVVVGNIGSNRAHTSVI